MPTPGGTAPAPREVRVVPWPKYDERTGEPWWSVNVRTAGRSYWLAWGGRQHRFARSKEAARAQRDGRGAVLEHAGVTLRARGF